MGHSKGKIIVGLFILLIVSLLCMQYDRAYENEIVLLVMNIFFTGALPVIAAAAAARAYLRDAGTGALFMGCGMLAFGLGNIAAGTLDFLPDADSVAVTVYSACALASAGCHLWSSQVAREPRDCLRPSRKMSLALSFSVILIIVAGLALGALKGLLPSFFEARGFARIRDIVPWGAIALYYLCARPIFVGVTMGQYGSE